MLVSGRVATKLTCSCWHLDRSKKGHKRILPPAGGVLRWWKSRGDGFDQLDVGGDHLGGEYSMVAYIDYEYFPKQNGGCKQLGAIIAGIRCSLKSSWSSKYVFLVSKASGEDFQV